MAVFIPFLATPFQVLPVELLYRTRYLEFNSKVKRLQWHLQPPEQNLTITIGQQRSKTLSLDILWDSLRLHPANELTGISLQRPKEADLVEVAISARLLFENLLVI
jgi:DNA-binding PucR family transcriptional regulator